MADALNLFYLVFTNMIAFVFNDMLIQTGVSFGWVLVSCFVFGVLIYNIVNLPSKAPTTHSREKRSK